MFAMMRLVPVPGQATLDDLGTPLSEVTFCVIDLETTGGSAAEDRITEVGAVLLRGGECLGTFQTLVNPGRTVPPVITVLTGITDSMLVPAPTIETVLPSLLEFWGDAVLVGHNIAFDLGFLRAACARTDRATPEVPRVDTVALARRLFGDEVRNHRLGTLAEHLRLDHKPSHRALDDALATGDLLHVLLERAARLGVLGLDDLLGLPKIDRHPQAAKLKLTNQLPRRPGVYVFRDRDGRPLYVGKADQPAHPGPQLLLQRPPAEGGPAPAGDGAHRPHRLRRPHGGRGPRGPPHRRVDPSLQQGRDPGRGLHLPEADLQRGLPPTVGRAHHPGRRRLLPRAAAQHPLREAGGRGHRDRRCRYAGARDDPPAAGRRPAPPPSSAWRPARARDR